MPETPPAAVPPKPKGGGGGLFDTLKSDAGPAPVWVWVLLGTLALAVGFRLMRNRKGTAPKKAAGAQPSATDLSRMPIKLGDIYITVPPGPPGEQGPPGEPLPPDEPPPDEPPPEEDPALQIPEIDNPGWPQDESPCPPEDLGVQSTGSHRASMTHVAPSGRSVWNIAAESLSVDPSDKSAARIIQKRADMITRANNLPPGAKVQAGQHLIMPREGYMAGQQ